MSNRPTPITSLSSLPEKTSRWFERAAAALLEQLPCRQGCCHCCIGTFPVTILDQQQLQEGLARLPHAQRQSIQQNAQTQVTAIEARFPRLSSSPMLDNWPDRLTEQLAEEFQDLPCPALTSEGDCAVYAFRPLTCRSMGIPPDQDGCVEGACDIQTAIPIIRLSSPFREEEDRLAGEESQQLTALHRIQQCQGEELLLPYAFLPKKHPLAHLHTA
ncbi:MAG: YkgJ family cysteine cluster protein [Nitrospira sp.]|nr:YkgJ family cysteine cluster protein [Nitrospira sp.]